MSDELYDALTPPERALVFEEWNELERRKDTRAGVIAAAVVNSRFGATGPAKKPEDFFRYGDAASLGPSPDFLEKWKARPRMRLIAA